MSLVLLYQKLPTLIGEEETYLNTLHLCLFDANLTPAGGDSDSYYTEPTSDTGYSPQTFSFASATLNSSNQGELLASAVTFTFDHNAGDKTIYGYFYKDPADSHVVMAERFPTPAVITLPGQTIQVVPRKVMTTL